MDAVLLPEYAPSTPAPDYSSKPLPGERCIQRTPRQTISHHGQLSFTYQEHGMALTLRGCREEAGAPAFGLCSTVHGEFEPTDKEKIISVVAKVCAHISQASPHFQTPDQLEGRIIIKTRSRISSTSLLSKECTLWESDDGDTVCPSILPLSIAFPAHYLDPHSGRDVRLPPSFSVSRPRRAAVVYSLTLTVRKRRSLLFCMRSPRCVDLHIRVHTPHIL